MYYFRKPQRRDCCGLGCKRFHDCIAVFSICRTGVIEQPSQCDRRVQHKHQRRPDSLKDFNSAALTDALDLLRKVLIVAIASAMRERSSETLGINSATGIPR